jgi:hypothetical protein
LPKGGKTRLSVILGDAEGVFGLPGSELWITPCGVTLMNARCGTPAARPASLRIDGFATAKTATATSAAIESKPVKMRRLQNVGCLVCFVFIGIIYGRGGGVERGLGVTVGVAVEVGVVVGVTVGVCVAVAVGVEVGVSVWVAVGVGVGVDVEQTSVYCWLSLVGLPGPKSPATA